MILSTDTK